MTHGEHDEREHCRSVAEHFWFAGAPVKPRAEVRELAEIIQEQRAAAREDERAKVLEECASLIDRVHSGLPPVFDAGRFVGCCDLPAFIRALATKKGTTP